MEILKIMDKETFNYDVDVGPQNHIYYYITASLYTLKGVNKIDLARTIHYLINIMIIVYRNSESFENLPPVFYGGILFLVDAIHKNKDRTIFYKILRKNKNDTRVDSEDIFNDLSKEEVSLTTFFTHNITL